jgi:peptidyl-prolyl cis-trans isomerase A (cyclophilin A)
MKILNYFCSFSFAVLLAAGCSNQKPADSSPIITPVVTNQTPDNKETSSVAPGFANPAQLTEKAPETFKAQFDTTKGKFTIEVTRSLSPNGADRFYNLVRSGYFTDIAFFRVIPGFMCQFGIHGDPNVAAKWREANIGNNVNLDDMGFSPFGKVSDGMDVVDKINGEYGENPPEVQGRLQNEGNAYLKKFFPNLDYIKSATIIPADGAK